MAKSALLVSSSRRARREGFDRARARGSSTPRKIDQLEIGKDEGQRVQSPPLLHGECAATRCVAPQTKRRGAARRGVARFADLLPIRWRWRFLKRGGNCDFSWHEASISRLRDGSTLRTTACNLAGGGEFPRAHPTRSRGIMRC